MCTHARTHLEVHVYPRPVPFFMYMAVNMALTNSNKCYFHKIRPKAGGTCRPTLIKWHNYSSRVVGTQQ